MQIWERGERREVEKKRGRERERERERGRERGGERKKPEPGRQAGKEGRGSDGPTVGLPSTFTR
jgi:hypothetical protein